ncbi:MAG: hypothetical protein DMD82_03635 [Candidatus Rokuibacteriota bacterium]|nr:MAG: hypothetical protein DMD82_03635 [Candidatus Rokubacteria bacterium]
MSQHSVEKVIGILATDEGLRDRFTQNPRAALQELQDLGMELNACELHSLLHIDPQELSRFARAIGPRLQKTDLRGGCW